MSDDCATTIRVCVKAGETGLTTLLEPATESTGGIAFDRRSSRALASARSICSKRSPHPSSGILHWLARKRVSPKPRSRLPLPPNRQSGRTGNILLRFSQRVQFYTYLL